MFQIVVKLRLSTFIKENDGDDDDSDDGNDDEEFKFREKVPSDELNSTQINFTTSITSAAGRTTLMTKVRVYAIMQRLIRHKMTRKYSVTASHEKVPLISVKIFLKTSVSGAAIFRSDA